MAAEWYYRVQEGGHHSDYGPITAGMLKQLAAAGAVKPAMLIRKGADGKWCMAEGVRGLFPEKPAPTDGIEDIALAAIGKPDKLAQTALGTNPLPTDSDIPGLAGAADDQLDTRCPLCGFHGSWNGTNCLHCGGNLQTEHRIGKPGEPPVSGQAGTASQRVVNTGQEDANSQGNTVFAVICGLLLVVVIVLAVNSAGSLNSDGGDYSSRSGSSLSLTEIDRLVDTGVASDWESLSINDKTALCNRVVSRAEQLGLETDQVDARLYRLSLDEFYKNASPGDRRTTRITTALAAIMLTAYSESGGDEEVTWSPPDKPKPSGTVISSYLKRELPGVEIYGGWKWTGNIAHATVGYDGDDWNAYVSVNAAGTQLTGYRLKHIHVADVLFPQHAPYVPREK